MWPNLDWDGIGIGTKTNLLDRAIRLQSWFGGYIVSPLCNVGLRNEHPVYEIQNLTKCLIKFEYLKYISNKKSESNQIFPALAC